MNPAQRPAPQQAPPTEVIGFRLPENEQPDHVWDDRAEDMKKSGEKATGQQDSGEQAPRADAAGVAEPTLREGSEPTEQLPRPDTDHDARHRRPEHE